jgi:hypothetical protein
MMVSVVLAGYSDSKSPLGFSGGQMAGNERGHRRVTINRFAAH